MLCMHIKYLNNTCLLKLKLLCIHMLTERHSRSCPSHQHSGGTSAEDTDSLRYCGG